MGGRDFRQAAERRGRQAETLSVWFLRLKGYRILARGFRCPLGEVDVIAQKGGVIAFVEVKARKDLRGSLEAISAKQRNRIENAAQVFLQQNTQLAEAGIRFDVIGVFPWKLPCHFKDAWRPRV